MATSTRATAVRTASLVTVGSLLLLGPAAAAAVSPPLDYFTLIPCRVVDTRTAGGPLVAGFERTFPLAGTCGIPATATAVSINVAVVDPTAAGNVRLYPAGSPVPTASTINYAAGQTRTNNTIVGLGAGGALAAQCLPAGSTHLIVDVNGYAAPRAGGTPCDAANQCISNFCVDGVCCDTACTGLCSACSAAAKGSGSDGVCGSVGQGTDPDNECAQQAASTCGTNGSCDGSGACQLWVSGTICAAPSCVAGVQTNASTCNGIGNCNANGTVSCQPYVCNAGGTGCVTSCTLDAHCATGNYCSAGSCVAKKPNGVACGGGNQCNSSFCADGFCCNTACTSPCMACDISVGTCTNVPYQEYPHHGICPNCGLCTGGGTCCTAAQCTPPFGICTR
jgi:hypothetical protein